MSDLVPPNVISNIFSRLPVKSVLRFRCVSKPVCSLIDSPHFINSHLQQSLNSNSNRTIVTASIDCTRIYYIDFDLYNRAATLINHPFKHCGANFIGSCNGLIALLTTSSLANCVSEIVVQPDPPNLDLVLVNPTTRNHKLLPVSPIEYPACYLKTMCEYVTYGFGYDSVKDDYIVVRIAQFPNVVQNEVKIYSLKTNEWRRGKDFPYRLSSTSHGEFVNGALHWIVRPQGLQCGFQLGMIALFDLGTEEYRLLLPPQLPDSDASSFLGTLRVVGGKLSLQCNYDARYIDIWVMENYGLKESWTRIISVVQNVGINFLYLKPLAYSNDGKKVLLEQESGQLLWYDLELKVFYKIRNPVIPPFFKAYVSLESLVKLSPGASTDLTQVKRKTKKKKSDDFLSKGFNLVL